MSIEVIKEGNVLRVVESSEPIPEGVVLQLFTQEELVRIVAGYRAMPDLQMPSFIRGDEDESVEDIFVMEKKQ